MVEETNRKGLMQKEVVGPLRWEGRICGFGWRLTVRESFSLFLVIVNRATKTGAKHWARCFI